MRRVHEPRVSGFSLPGEGKIDKQDSNLQQAEVKIRSLFSQWKELDDRLLNLAGQRTWTHTLAELCRELQNLTESLTELLETKPQLKKMRRRPRYSEQELIARKRRALMNPNQKVRQLLLKDLEDSFFKN